MNEDDKSLLIETIERSKSNTHQIDDIKSDIKELQNKQEMIYDLTTSVKVMAENLSTVKDDVKEIKQGQSALSDKVDNQINEIKTDVDNKVETVKHDVKQIDDEGKFNIRVWIRDNWIAISALLVLGIGIIKNFIG